MPGCAGEIYPSRVTGGMGGGTEQPWGCVVRTGDGKRRNGPGGGSHWRVSPGVESMDSGKSTAALGDNARQSCRGAGRIRDAGKWPRISIAISKECILADHALREPRTHPERVAAGLGSVSGASPSCCDWVGTVWRRMFGGLLPGKAASRRGSRKKGSRPLSPRTMMREGRGSHLHKRDGSR